MHPSFIMLVGLPGSGKSTYRETLHGFVQLSTDDIIEDVALRVRSTYDKVWADYVVPATKLLNARLAEALRERKSIILDRTNLSAGARRKVLSRVSKDYIKSAVYFEIDEGLRQARMAQRVGKHIPAAADAQMLSWYVRPTLEEGFDNIINGAETQAVAA